MKIKPPFAQPYYITIKNGDVITNTTKLRFIKADLNAIKHERIYEFVVKVIHPYTTILHI